LCQQAGRHRPVAGLDAALAVAIAACRRCPLSQPAQSATRCPAPTTRPDPTDMQLNEVPVLREIAQPREPMPPDGIPASVLIVDDNPSKLKAITAMVSRMGLDITTANSGREALRLLLKQDFAVILLDVKMPVMDGFETATLIHGRPRSAHTPVIFITAEASSDSDRFRGYTMGAVDYIFSPIMPEVL